MNKLISLVGMQLLPEIPKKSCMTELSLSRILVIDLILCLNNSLKLLIFY
jgi:hypothetical protein